jgi:SAM-dependent methyltransferase
MFDGSEAQESQDFEFAALTAAENYRAAIARFFSPHLKGNIVEIGSGVGQMLADIQKICQPRQVTAVEPNPTFIPQLQTRLPFAEVIEGTVEHLPAGAKYDGLLSVNVLEHIQDDVSALRQCHARVLPGTGHLCILVPARPELYSPIDKDFGHFRRYTKEELREKLQKAGFTPLKVSYYNFIGYFGWLINFRLLARRGFDPMSVRLFDRIIFPPCNRLERTLGWCPLGQSVVAIARA